VTDVVQRTACGLYVMRDGNPYGWSNFTRTTEVADMSGNQEDLDALAFIGREIMGQVGTATTGEYVTPVDVAFACLHPGAPERAVHPALDSADPEVPDYILERDGWLVPANWTVCGVLGDSWMTCSYDAVAGSALVAYFKAWEFFRDQHGEHMLLAAVHPGHVEVIQGFAFADPWAHSDLGMRNKARNEWGV
jgi:hypothetical protein